MYRKYHQERLEELHTAKRNADGKTVWLGTKASTYMPSVEVSGGTSDFVNREFDVRAATSRPKTEYADSSFGTDCSTDKLRTPHLLLNGEGVRVQFGEDFVCPYCQRPQLFETKAEWK